MFTSYSKRLTPQLLLANKNNTFHIRKFCYTKQTAASRIGFWYSYRQCLEMFIQEVATCSYFWAQDLNSANSSNWASPKYPKTYQSLFPSLPTVQFLMACNTFPGILQVLQVIKNWMVGRPGMRLYQGHIKPLLTLCTISNGYVIQQPLLLSRS